MAHIKRLVICILCTACICAASLKVTKIQGDVYILSCARGHAYKANQKLYTIDDSEVTAILEIIETFDTYVKAKLVAGIVPKESPVYDSKLYAYSYLFSNDDLDAIHAYITNLSDRDRSIFMKYLHAIISAYAGKTGIKTESKEDFISSFKEIYKKTVVLKYMKRKELFDFTRLVYAHYVGSRVNIKQFDSFIYTYPRSRLLDYVYFFKGVELFEKNKSYKAARESLLKTIKKKRSPVETPAMYYLGKLYLNWKDFVSAKHYFTEIIKRQNAHYLKDASLGLYEIYIIQNNHEQADEILKYVLKIGKNDKKLKEEIEYYQFRIYLLYENNIEKAKKFRDAFNKKYKGSVFRADMSFLAGGYYVKKGNYAKALEEYEDVIREHPKHKKHKQAFKNYLYASSMICNKGKTDAGFKLLQSIYPGTFLEEDSFIMILDNFYTCLQKTDFKDVNSKKILKSYLSFCKKDFKKNSLIMGKYYETLFMLNFYTVDAKAAVLQILSAFEKEYPDSPYLSNIHYFLCRYYYRLGFVNKADTYAYYVLKSGKNQDRIAEIFSYFKIRLSRLYNDSEQKELANKARDVYKKNNTVYKGFSTFVQDIIKKTKRSRRDWQKGKTHIIRDALVFSEGNRFRDFENVFDIYDHGYQEKSRMLTISGERPGMESKIFKFKAHTYKTAEIHLSFPGKRRIEKGVFRWQTWAEGDWNARSALPFAVNDGDTSVVVRIPLASSNWRGIIRKLRIDFYNKSYTPGKMNFKIEKIILY
ncbi:hypothetical protein ACFL6D_00485 [Spirochaetota bacterium]